VEGPVTSSGFAARIRLALQNRLASPAEVDGTRTPLATAPAGTAHSTRKNRSGAIRAPARHRIID
jgi:hypothetical protein